MNIQQLRERYAAPEIPKCRVCGGELTVQRAGGGATIWGCTGMIGDPTGERNWIYAEGRSCADEHYERSRWSDYRQGGDAEVIELIDALEAAERERDELRAEQAEHDEQIARMEGKFSLAKRALDSKAARCDRAEAELARRDAAAGEPVAFTHESEISNMHATGLYLRGFPADRLLNSEEGYTVPLYTAAPPAASAPTAMQPLYIAGDGRIRFKENAIVRHLLTSAGKVGVDLNSIAMDDFSDDDRMQLAQLIGYSLGGYGELSYVSDESYNAAVAAATVPGGDGE